MYTLFDHALPPVAPDAVMRLGRVALVPSSRPGVFLLAGSDHLTLTTAPVEDLRRVLGA